MIIDFISLMAAAEVVAIVNLIGWNLFDLYGTYNSPLITVISTISYVSAILTAFGVSKLLKWLRRKAEFHHNLMNTISREAGIHHKLNSAITKRRAMKEEGRSHRE